jgi:hypothetical protein
LHERHRAQLLDEYGGLGWVGFRYHGPTADIVSGCYWIATDVICGVPYE